MLVKQGYVQAIMNTTVYGIFMLKKKKYRKVVAQHKIASPISELRAVNNERFLRSLLLPGAVDRSSKSLQRMFPGCL